jgi:hypothetical protein
MTFWGSTNAPGIQKAGGSKWWNVVVPHVVAALQQIKGAITGGSGTFGATAGILKQPTAALSASVPETGTLTAQAQKMASAWVAAQQQQAQIAAALPAPPAAALAGSEIQTYGSFAAALKQATSGLTAAELETGTIAATLKQATTAFAGSTVLPGPLFDACHGIGLNQVNPATLTHTAAAGATILFGLSNFDASAGAPTIKYGTLSATQIGSKFTFDPTNNNSFWLFKLTGAPTGLQTITVTNPAADVGSIVVASFTNVNSIGAAQTTNSNSTTTASQTVSCTTGQRIVQMFTSLYPLNAAPSGGTNRYFQSADNSQGFAGGSLNDATATTTFTGLVTTGGQYWGGLAVVLS